MTVPATADQRETAPDAVTTWRPTFPVNAPLTLSLLRHGRGDPCQYVAPDGAIWRASRMDSGPSTCRIVQDTPHAIKAQAWGSGADEAIDALPRLLGADDNPEDFVPRHPMLATAHARLVGLRVPASGRVLESLVPAVLEQKVLGLDASAAWRRLVTRFGEPAPGPAPVAMRLAPDPAGWLAIASWEWHEAGVEQRRAHVIRRCADYAAKLESADRDEAYRILLTLPGVGRWTAAQVGHRVFGDADALPIGDYHLADATGWALAGGRLADDQVEAFYEPWRPHRFRVIRLIELTPAAARPRRGPRMPRQDFRRI